MKLKARILVNGLASSIHHALLQLYKAEDLETVEVLLTRLDELKLDRYKVDVGAIHKRVKEQIASGEYTKAINSLDGTGSYAVLPKIMFIVDQIEEAI